MRENNQHAGQVANPEQEAPMAIVQQQSKRRVTNVPTAIVDWSTRRVVYQSKSSDDDKIHWIAIWKKTDFFANIVLWIHMNFHTVKEILNIHFTNGN